MLSTMNASLRQLREDGIFARVTNITDGILSVENTTYITDSEDGRILECLTVDPETPYVGTNDCSVCPRFTLGFTTTPPRGSFRCPCCDRYSKPHTLVPRIHVATFRLTATGAEQTTDKTNMPVVVAERILGVLNLIEVKPKADEPVWQYKPDPDEISTCI
jgi:hypothetical protein